MTVSEVRTRYLEFFKKRGHAIIPSSSLVPENDSTTLFTSSGMQPLVPYLMGQPHPEGTRLADSQTSFRAEDIEEVGDNRHTTFFEMLGNWSLGDYFKREQIPWLFEFLTTELGLHKEKLRVTCFEGDEALGLPRDTESAKIWKECGIAEDHIHYYPAKKNWWSRSGTPETMPAGEMGGTDTEVFFDFGIEHDKAYGEVCHPNCDCGRFVEIGNSVFMEYVKNEDGSFGFLPKKNVDFGGGLERLVAATNGNPDIFLINVFDSARNVLESRSGKRYEDEEATRSFRIILDHMRAAAFFIASGIRPGNSEQGYILRRLIRRAIREADKLGIKGPVLAEVAGGFGAAYADQYQFVLEAMGTIQEELKKEEVQFRKILTIGMHELDKWIVEIQTQWENQPQSDKRMVLPAEGVFKLVTTIGLPIDIIREVARERNFEMQEDRFEKLMTEHQAKSRSGASQKFKGGLADASEDTTMLHTCTHLMLAGLRTYLGDHVHQAGSNITAERTRFDFTHHEKVSRDVLDRVEAYVNEAIEKGAMVTIEQMPKSTAREQGVEGSFWEKYPDTVNVYTITADDGTIYSQELCGGPHVESVCVIRDTGKRFKIIKEEASSAGVRRVKAVLQ